MRDAREMSSPLEGSVVPLCFSVSYCESMPITLTVDVGKYECVGRPQLTPPPGRSRLTVQCILMTRNDLLV